MDYQKIVEEQARAMNVTACPVQEQGFGSAATDLSTIYINPRFADKIYGTSGLNGIRFVLAHELGHARGGARGGHEGEHLADRWAAQSVARVGVGFDAISGVMSHLNQQATKSHPGAGERASAAQSAWSEAIAIRAPQIGTRRDLNGEEVPRPLVKAAKPPRQRYHTR